MNRLGKHVPAISSKRSKILHIGSFTSFFLLCYHLTAALQCVDHNNKKVDWYIVYKIPKIKDSNTHLVDTGEAYAFITSKNQNKMVLSKLSINDTESIIGRTLKPLYKKNSKKVMHIAYNDQAPDKTCFNHGHAKGVILGNKRGGFWLKHSVPQFPPFDAHNYYYPRNGYTYGQTFLCVSFSVKNLNKLGVQLQYIEPVIYAKQIPFRLKFVYPGLVDVMNNVVVKSQPWYNLQVLKSQDNVQFLSFAKNPMFHKDVYQDWIASTLGTDLLVQSWHRGKNSIPSECDSEYKVNNIEQITVNSGELKFKAMRDHSKWAVTAAESRNNSWFCIGDLNRAVTQKRRGGETLCLNITGVAQIYQNSVEKIEKCHLDLKNRYNNCK